MDGPWALSPTVLPSVLRMRKWLSQPGQTVSLRPEHQASSRECPQSCWRACICRYRCFVWFLGIFLHLNQQLQETALPSIRPDSKRSNAHGMERPRPRRGAACPEAATPVFQDAHHAARTTHYGALPQKSQHGRPQDENPVVHFFKNIVSGPHAVSDGLGKGWPLPRSRGA